MMRILLKTRNLFTRSQLEGAWGKAGARMLGDEVGVPDLIVLDLTLPDAEQEIARLRARFPGVELLVFGPHVDGTAFKRARTAGSTAQVARGKVVERVLARLNSAD